MRCRDKCPSDIQLRWRGFAQQFQRNAFLSPTVDGAAWDYTGLHVIYIVKEYQLYTAGLIVLGVGME